jgi:hypothetical protein
MVNAGQLSSFKTRGEWSCCRYVPVSETACQSEQAQRSEQHLISLELLYSLPCRDASCAGHRQPHRQPPRRLFISPSRGRGVRARC